ncbi:MAG: serine/threonine-protein kinase [Pseudonocardiaceae bacterium]
MDSGSVVFDRYRLEERIGKGGMGVVWRATDLLLDQAVALKRVFLAGADDHQTAVTQECALREARLAARLRHHRHVVATYDVRMDDGDVWLVMEYLPARSLAQILRERGPLDPGQAARIGAQVADALAAAHALGIEHRDVTPGNVLITDDGTAKLTDFGISHLAGDTQVTQTGVVCGTFAYLAPEVAKNGKSSPASDVFSLGSTLYAAIEGLPPFGTADNPLQLLNIVGVGIIRPPTAAGALTPLLLRLLELDPATRLDAAAARDKLDDFASQVPAAHPPIIPQPRRWPARQPVLTVILALITLAALAGGTALALVNSRDDLPAAGGSAQSSTAGPIPPPPVVVRPNAEMPQPSCASCGPGGTTFTQQVHTSNPAGTNTFQEPRGFGGQGPRVLPGQQVQVVCRFFDPNAPITVQPGWWYLVDSPPWNRQYYTPANSYLNGDPAEGPYRTDVDERVPVC